MNGLRKLLARFLTPTPHLHPCQMCCRMMHANGYGLCAECLEIIDDPKEDYCAYMAKHRPDMRQIG